MNSRDPRVTRLALAAALLGTALLWLWLVASDPRFFWRNDFQLWYSPIFEETVRAWHSGEWPILSPSSWATANLGGEYQAGTFSVWHNALLLAIWSLNLSLPGKAAALALVHFCVIAAGTVMLCRRRGWPAHVSAITALIAASSGWLVTWGANQWYVAMSGFAWIPWAWWSLENALANGASRRTRWLVPAVFVYLTIASGSPFSVVMLGIVTAWLGLRHLCIEKRPLAVFALIVAWIAGLALSAPAWWMLIETFGTSVRADWGLSTQWNWVVPWRAWLGLIAPGIDFPWRDFWAQLEPRPASVLLGGTVPIGALAAWFLAKWHRKRVGFGATRMSSEARWLFGFTLALAVLCSVPLIGSFRWSYRFLPLFHLVLALAAGEALCRLKPKSVAATSLALLAVASALAAVCGALGNVRFLCIQATLLLVWWWLAHGRKAAARWIPAVVVIAIAGAGFTSLDLQRSSFAYNYHLDENILQPGPLERDRLYLSVYSSADTLAGFRAPLGWGTAIRPGNTAMCAGVHFLNGYSSFTTFGVAEWFETFGDCSEAKAARLLNPAMDPIYSLLGVDGIVIGTSYLQFADQLAPGWEAVVELPEGTVFHHFPRRAWPARPAILPDVPSTKFPVVPALTNDWEEGRQSVRVTLGPSPMGATEACAIIFSRPYLPGYIATMNGQPREITVYGNGEHALRVPTVRIAAGETGELVLKFHPPSLRYGVPIALSILALWSLALVFMRPAASLRSPE